MFRDRHDAAQHLAVKLRGRPLHDPLVLAIPRGGIVLGAVLARELGAELDVVLSRKLRAPGQPEFALGAISEDGRVYLNSVVKELPGLPADYVTKECHAQFAEIERRTRLFRSARPKANIADRSVVVTDDGIATGATMIACLQCLRAQRPRELIVAVPVASPDRLKEVRRWCDEVVCLLAPDGFMAVGEFYEDFRQIEDAEVVRTLAECQSSDPGSTPVGEAAIRPARRWPASKAAR